MSIEKKTPAAEKAIEPPAASAVVPAVVMAEVKIDFNQALILLEAWLTSQGDDTGFDLFSQIAAGVQRLQDDLEQTRADVVEKNNILMHLGRIALDASKTK